MNFERAIVWKTDVAMERSKYKITLDDVKCDVPDWKKCSFQEFSNCFHREDIFLSCLLKGWCGKNCFSFFEVIIN